MSREGRVIDGKYQVLLRKDIEDQIYDVALMEVMDHDNDYLLCRMNGEQWDCPRYYRTVLQALSEMQLYRGWIDEYQHESVW